MTTPNTLADFFIKASPGYIERSEREGQAAAAWHRRVEPPTLFYLLINFSDCEGTLGTADSKRLAQEFTSYQAKAEEMFSNDSHWVAKYNLWKKAFYFATKDGCVEFS